MKNADRKSAFLEKENPREPCIAIFNPVYTGGCPLCHVALPTSDFGSDKQFRSGGLHLDGGSSGLP